MTETPAGGTFNVDWSGADEIPAQVVNTMLAQSGVNANSEDGITPDGIYLILGEAAPPIIYGDDDTMRRQVAGYDGRIRVKPAARLFMTRARVEELVGVLQTALQKYDAAVAEGKAIKHG